MFYCITLKKSAFRKTKCNESIPYPLHILGTMFTAYQQQLELHTPFNIRIATKTKTQLRLKVYLFIPSSLIMAKLFVLFKRPKTLGSKTFMLEGHPRKMGPKYFQIVLAYVV